MSKRHATDALASARVEDVLRIRLDGAEFHDLREFVREKEGEAGNPWTLPDGATPLSDVQLRRYQQKADVIIRESVDHNRDRAVRQHLAQRRALYGKAVTSGDLRTALAVLRDDALLRGLYPEGQAPGAASPAVQVVIELVEEVRVAHPPAPTTNGHAPSRSA